MMAREGMEDSEASGGEGHHVMIRVRMERVPVTGHAARATLDAARRHARQRTDQALALSARRLGPARVTAPWDGHPRFALLTVNFSTTRYLKLMLLTLAEQHDLGLLSRIVVVDNGSVDGAGPLLDQLECLDRVTVVRHRRRLSHAAGMRAALRALRAAEQGVEHATPAAPAPPANVLLFCDTDVIFRNPDTLRDLADVFRTTDAAFAGELRRGLYPHPEAQASFLAVRRDWAERRRTDPWVDHGAPAYWLQRSIWAQGGVGHDFPSNRGGHILHRGRAGVAAAQRHFRFHPYASASYNQPHFMGVPGGERIWREVEERHAGLLDGDPAGVVRVLAAALATAPPAAPAPDDAATPGRPAAGRASASPGSVTIPVAIRVHLAHAALQAVADSAGADVLHIKGPALIDELRLRPAPQPSLPNVNQVPRERPASVDADLLVRPSHFRQLMAELRHQGWQQVTPFLDEGLVQHSTVWFHPSLGQADLHYRFPGIQAAPEHAFGRLWQDREHLEIAHQACTVPSPAGQRLILLLHAARDPFGRAEDVTVAWHQADDAARAAARDLAGEVGAVVGLDAAIGRLEDHRDQPEYALWRLYADGESTSGGFTKLVALAKAAPEGYTHVRARVVRHAVRAVLRAPARLEAGMTHRPSAREVAGNYRRLLHRATDLRRVVGR